MLSGPLASAARVRLTLCYALAVAVVTIAMTHMTPAVQAALIRHSSTNLHNLGHGRLGTLVGSAFVVDAGPLYLWLPGLVCLLAAAELACGSGRLAIAATAGHIGASALVAAGLALAVESGWMGRAVAHEPDVGMSYVAMSALGALTAAIPPRWRPAWAGWWLAAAVTVVATGADFTDVGHVLALGLGMVVTLPFAAASRWTGPMVLLSGAGAVFAALVLTGDPGLLAHAVPWGIVGALAFHGLFGGRFRRQSVTARRDAGRPDPRADADNPTERHSRGGSVPESGQTHRLQSPGG